MYRAPRGTSDILPQEQAYWQYIRQKALSLCQLYGYERIDAPSFEDTGLFIRSVGEGTDIVEKQMYTFDDRGGNQLTLRPEGTAPVCRAYLEHGMHNLTQPVKLYYIASIFRYERPQASRYREHHQFGCEAIGDDDPTLDAEVISMAWQFFLSLGLRNFSLQLNSIGCNKCRPAYISSLKGYYGSHTDELCSDCKTRLKKNPLRLLDCKKPLCQQLAKLAPRSADNLCPQCGEHFSRLRRYLRLLELPFTVNHCLVRGLDYYTKTVFEIQPEREGAQSALGGGGRYDSLIEELGGKPTPAIGFATGIERMVLNLKEQGIPVTPTPRPLAFIAHIGDQARDEAIKLANTLRQAEAGAMPEMDREIPPAQPIVGIILAVGNKSLKAQLRQANNLSARYTVIIGDEEVKNGVAIMRDMTTSQQKTVPTSKLWSQLSEIQAPHRQRIKEQNRKQDRKP